MTDCARCGDCCEAIYTSQTKNERWASMVTDRQMRRHPDNRFLMAHWHPISVEEARRIRPSADLPVVDGRTVGQFYRCDQFDAERRLCRAQDRKPFICSKFPWYEDNPALRRQTPENMAESLAPWPRCSYWADVPRARWPEGVNPLPSPTFIPLDRF